MKTVLAALPARRPISFFAVAILASLIPALVTSAAPPVQDATARVTFADSVSELPATQKATLHAMTAEHAADRIGFNIPLALRNQAELEARVSRGEVLSGDEMREKYLPLPADYDTVATWLRGEGFVVDEFGGAPLAVFAHGTAAQVQASFGVEMGLITADGADRVVTRTAPSLPAAIARPALGVSGLSYHRPKPRIVRHDGVTPAAVPSGGYHIADIRKAYSGASLTVNGTTLDGTGQSIGIEAYLFPKTADLTAFWTANSITRKGTVTNVDLTQTGTSLATDTDDLGETELDVEWASGIAPGANIVVYATNEVNNDDAQRIYSRALSDAMASGSTMHTFSSSYGPTEAALTTTEKNAYNNLFMSMGAAGLTYVTATGDIGSGNGSTLTPEAFGDCPYATGVGGTNLQVNLSTGARTSEVVWGRTTGTTTGGSSGGLSKFFAKPAWQTGTGTPTGSFRGEPDLALAADYENSPAYYYTNGSAGEVGGTSWSAPTFAGFLAMIQQGRALNTPARGALGFINPRLYPLIGTANFYDVTSGNNGAYTATTGYDLCTGVGVPTVSTLLTTWLGPTLTSFTPATGGAGTSVVITGTNFYTGPTVPLTVTFGGVAASSLTVNSATQITVTVPSSATTGSIVVTSFGDAATSSTNFTVGGTTAAPTITGFSPTSGAVGTSVVITGTNLSGATAVSFNGTAATSFTSDSATQITATVPTGATSGAISVTTAGGATTSTATFTVTTTTAAPTITGFSPTSGAVGTSVTITGTNFTGATAVSFNGTAATFTVNSATQITATVPTGATTGTISVTTPGGAVASSGAFTVTTSGGTGHPVISQIYGGGGNSGATYASDYIELYNPTSSAVSLTGYSVQYASATGANFTGVTSLSGSIAAHGYYLVKESTVTTGTALPTADATGTISMAAAAGRVALVSNTTAITNKSGAGVIDYVGYGTSASDYEGSGPAPAPSATTADLRAGNGATDTDNNAADFTAGTPNPRNSATVATGTPDLTITCAHAGNFTQADTGDTYTITVTNSGTAATTGATVTVTDTLPSGLTATAFSGTGWTCNVSTLTATRSDALAATGSYPPLTLTVSVSSTASASVTNTVTVAGGGETNTSNDTASDATSITALTPSQSWRYQYFGTTANTGNAADTANPSGDGMPNLLKYALGLDPRVPTTNPETQDTTTGYLRLTVPKNANATDVTYTVQVTGDLTDASSWTTSGTTVLQNTATVLQVQDNTPVSGTAKRFIRLLVTH